MERLFAIFVICLIVAIVITIVLVIRRETKKITLEEKLEEAREKRAASYNRFCIEHPLKAAMFEDLKRKRIVLED